MDIPRTDSPIAGFDFPSSTPLTRPSPGWIRALPPSSMPFIESKPEQCDELCSEAEADLAALVHHLSFPADRHPAYCHSRSSSLDTISTIGHSPCSSALHTPSSSMDYHSLAKSRSLASLKYSPSARREAVYIVDDDDDEDFEADGVQFPYRMVDDDYMHEPPSRFSIDEEERPRSIRALWTRSRVFSMSSPPTPTSTTPTPPTSPTRRVPPPIPPSPPSPAAKRKSKRKTTFSMLSMFHIGLPTF